MHYGPQAAPHIGPRMAGKEDCSAMMAGSFVALEAFRSLTPYRD